MAAEVNPRQCIPAGEEKPSVVIKPSRKVRAAGGGRTRSTEQLDKPVKHEEEYGARTSVLQSKVKALKEKNMKERKETRILKDEGGEIDKEDALMSPQLRTYLTEELLDCTKQGGYSGAHQGSWGCDELWGTYSSDGSSDVHSNGCKIVNSSNHSQNPGNNSSLGLQERLQPSSNDLGVPENTTARDSVSLTLAEKVERNRQELRSKFGKASNHGGEITHSQGKTSKSREYNFKWS